MVGVRHLRAVLGDRARAGAARRADAGLRRRDARRDEPLRRRGVEPQRRPVRRLLRLASPRSRRSTRRDGVLYVRPPVVGAGTIDGRVAGTAAVLLVGIGVTAFDGASEGPLFNDVLPHLQDFFARARVRAGDGARARLRDGAARDRRARGADLDRSRGRARELAHSLVPILAAYVVAHYFSLLAYNGQDLRAARVRPARRRLRPVRRRRDGHRLRRRLGDGDLVRPGRRARARPRRGARARARPRARDLRQPPCRDALADRHAGADGVLHLPRACGCSRRRTDDAAARPRRALARCRSPTSRRSSCWSGCSSPASCASAASAGATKA